MSEHKHEGAFGSEAGDTVVVPNESPHRFGPRPTSSPILARQWDEMVARETAREEEAAKAQAEDDEIERLAQRAAAVERRKREILGDA